MRKHEKKLRGMIVDYKKRSERRKEYYERIKRDPAEFLQIWGRPAKIHLDPSIATAAEATLTPWRDDETTMIDRFDVRSHLDVIDEYALKSQQNQQGFESLSEIEQNEERVCNYERYRVLIHNESNSVSEEQCLRDIEFDEKFGALRDDHHPASKEAKKKKSATKKAEIGFVYDDAPVPTLTKKSTAADNSDESDEDDNDEDLDLDIEIDITQLTSENKASLNKVATHYGMAFGDFARMLILDREEMQAIKDNKLEREQDIPVKGRRARRERRLAKERRIKERDFCPPSYLSREIPKLPVVKAKSKSRSPSPVDTTPLKEKIEFITAFGDDETSKNNELKRKRPFEKSLLDECREAKKKAEPTTIPIKVRRLVTPPRLPTPTTSIVPCRSVQRKSQVFLSTLQKLKEDSSPERRVLSDDEISAIKVIRTAKKEENKDDDEEDNEDDDDLQQYLKRKEARQRNLNLSITPTNHKEQNGSNESTTLATKASMIKTPQEKLRRRMQSLLKKQFQKDKDLQRERQQREEKEREVRESELRQSSSKLRHRRSRHHSGSRSRSRTRSHSPSSRRRRQRSSSTSSSSSSSSSSTSSSSPSRHSSDNRKKKRASPVKPRSPTPEFLRQRFRRNYRRRASSSSSSSASSSRSDRSSSKRKRTDYK
ncbi:unnamed protein product [Rotaria magnacalcarata]|nr:unnamed protein product [Rotaria magnacalcarata]CAF3866951.1 unnamed protein product [Rotaria magnacalcarata]